MVVSTVSRSSRESAHGTRFVWNSLRSTLRDPSKRSEAVMLETTCFVNDQTRLLECEVELHAPVQ